MASFKLRDYQEEALESIRDALHRGVDRQLIVMPTGSGKTFTFCHIPKRVVPGRMLVLAHREELLIQAKESFHMLYGDDVTVDVEQAENYADTKADIVVATVQTLGRSDSDRIERFDRDHFTTVVVDEAHHSSAANTTYMNILNYFKPLLRLGVTATPQRGDGVRLFDVFDEIVYFRTIQDMIKEGYLVDMVGYRINTDVDISGVTTRAGDYAIGELASAINIESRNKVAVQSYLEHAEGRKALTFCATVDHAQDMAKAFNLAGINTECVIGTTSKDDRKEIYKKFDSGEIQVLTSVGVLTEGFDQPDIGCIILARPTKSPVVFSQAIGRGLRLAEDKEDCIILDLCDATSGKKPVGLPTLMGLPPDFDLEGTSAMDAEAKYKELEEEAPNEAAQVKSLSDIEEAWERIDLFLPPPRNDALMELTDFVWMETSNDHYVLWLSPQEKFIIESDALGKWNVFFQDNNEGKRKITDVEDIQEAFTRTDAWIRNNRTDQVKLLDANAEWRSEPPTDKQIKWLKKFDVPITKTLSKGQATQILDKLFKENPKPKRSARQEWAIKRAKQRRRNKW